MCCIQHDAANARVRPFLCSTKLYACSVCVRVCMCALAPEVLLGGDVSFLFSSLLCSVLYINCIFLLYIFILFFLYSDCCCCVFFFWWHFYSLGCVSMYVSVCGPAYQISAYIIHNGYQMTAMISILRYIKTNKQVAWQRGKKQRPLTKLYQNWGAIRL